MMGKPSRMRGKGNFFGDVLSKGKKIIGGFIQPGDFERIGSRIGGGMGNVLSEVTGMGDYTIKKNSIVERMPVGANGELDKRFSFSDTGTATIRVKKREYLGQVLAGTSPGDFQQIQYRLQATDPKTFPWMSTIAELFTEWRMIGAILSYESTSSNYSSTVGLGTVAIATQYNANMLPYSDMDSVLQSAYHTRGNPSEDLIHGIECDPKLQASERLYTRRPGAEGPPNLYDHGVVTIATEGMDAGTPADTTLGRLYITYEIELSLPELGVKSPFQHAIGLSVLQANATRKSCLGPALTMSAASTSEMTFGVATGSNILLLGSATGPLTRPAMTPSEQAELCVWINDSSGTAELQYMSFARAGHYIVTIYRAGVAGIAYVTGDCVIAALKDTVVTTVFFNGQPGAVTDFNARWMVHVEVKVAGGSITLLNTKDAADTGSLELTVGG
jgi:hypothetical protein